MTYYCAKCCKIVRMLDSVLMRVNGTSLMLYLHNVMVIMV